MAQSTSLAEILNRIQKADKNSWISGLAAMRDWSKRMPLPPDMAAKAQRLEDLLAALQDGEIPWDEAKAKWEKIAAQLPEDSGFHAKDGVPENIQAPIRVRKRKKNRKKPTETLTAVQATAVGAGAFLRLDLSLLHVFLDDHQGEIERLEGLVLELERGDRAAIPEIRRKVHTFKGELGLLDLGHEVVFLHGLEEKIEKNEASAEELLNALKRMHRVWQGMQQAAGNQGVYFIQEEKAPDNPIPAGDAGLHPSAPAKKPTLPSGLFSVAIREDEAAFLTDFKTESAEHFQFLSAHILELEGEPDSENAINGIFRVYHSIKGVAGFLNLTPVQIFSHALESLVARARSHQITLGAKEINVLLAASDVLKDMIAGAEYKEGKVQLQVAAGAPHALAALQEYDAADEPKKGERVPSAPAYQPANGGEGAETAESLPADPKQAHSSSAGEDTLRVSAKKLDQLFNALGEVVIAQSIIAGDPVLRATDRRIERKELLALRQKIQACQNILGQVQKVTLSLRMVSIKPLFVKMARLTRDVSQKTQKVVEFNKMGEETEIDKSFVEKLGDPLVHMIRNSVDHGIESPEARLLAGKPEKGSITLRAYHRSGRFYLELEDDGKGLDPEVILRKAIEKGLVAQGIRLEQEAIFRLILEPGFSTAQQVTDLSGRGVGMDVVRQTLEGMGGSLAIHSEKGKGTRFTLSLPLTLAIVNGMFVRTGDQVVIIPTLSILECVNPRAGQIESLSEDSHLLDLRGKWIRLCRLTSILGMPSSPMPFTDGVAVVVENGLGGQIALFVEELLGGQQVVIKSLGDAIPVPDGIQGGAVGSDGKVRLILDITQIVTKASIAGAATGMRKEMAEA